MWRSRMPSLLASLEEQQRRRITQQEISEATGIRQPTISVWMNWGTFNRLDGNVVARLASFFGCHPSELYEWVTEDEHVGQWMAVTVG